MEVSEGVRRKLREGETLYWTDAAPHHGKFVAYARWKNPFGRSQRSKTKSFNTEREALDYLVSLRKDKERLIGKFADRPLRDWFEFCAEKRWPGKIATVTIANKKSRWTRFIDPYLGSSVMRAVNKAVITSWLDELSDKAIPKTQLVEVKNDLHKLFEDAIDQEEFDRNPVRGAEVPDIELRSKVVLSTKEIHALLTSMEAAVLKETLPPWIVGMTACGLLAGLRKGECQALCWGASGVQLDAGFINVHRAIHRDESGHLTIGLPKGGKKRRVPIPPQLNEVLAKLKPSDLETAEGECRLVFESRNGGAIQPKQIKTWFDTLKKECGLPSQMQFRDTRATFASLLNSMALGQKTTLEMMGHESIGVTTERYMEALDDAKREAGKQIGKILRPKPSKKKASSTPPE